ncbi:universal stress protein [soil metagenome]
MWKKILCPVDFSIGSRVALREAARLITQSGGELVLAHIWAPPIFFAGGEAIGLPANQLTAIIGSAESMLSDAVSEARAAGARKVTPVFRSGAAWHEIVDIARTDPSIDAIVIGTHGRTGLTHALIGSVAEKVVRHAPCPVLVHRERPVN